MKSRRWVTWLIFGICALAVVEGLGWVTWKGLRFERAEREARAQASFQELVRLALWRMESEITPILAQEAAHPYFHYQPFFPAERAYTRMLQEVRPGEVLVPSPLLDASGPFMRVHYQIGPDGQVTSPQAPTGNLRDLAESQYVDSAYIILAGERLAELAEMVRPAPPAIRKDLVRSDLEAAVVPAVPSSPPLPSPSERAPGPSGEQHQYANTQTGQRLDAQSQSMFSEKEYQARQQVAQSAHVAPESRRGKGVNEAGARLGGKKEGNNDEGDVAVDKSRSSSAPSQTLSSAQPEGVAKLAPPPAPASAAAPPPPAAVREIIRDEAAKKPDEMAVSVDVSEVETGAFEPVWRVNPRTEQPELILRRAVTVAGTRLEQGIWIDWSALRAKLLAATRDLLPEADLVPVPGAPGGSSTGEMLASVPVLLKPGPPPPLAPDSVLSSAHVTLGVTWLAVLGGVVAIGLVLRTSMELGDRRGRFVSAVTHELRTPLTTFRLYTGMLAGGMVEDEKARKEYLSTLEAESGRLAGIVENVLDYARLGGRAAGVSEPVGAADLLAQVMPALERSAARCGMTLVVEGAPPPKVQVRADPATVERILLNLVDNACKYAAEAADKRIHLGIGLVERPMRGGLLELRVRDHGPGIPRSERREVFRAFHRAKRDVRGPHSGLGLGLSLSRGLARELGGDLEVGRVESGTELRITLPISYQNP